MTLYSLKDISTATGLNTPYIRKCLNRMADIFDPCRQRGVNNSIQLKNSGLTIFHQISRLKAQELEVPEIRQKLSENDLNGVPKPDQTGLEERG